MITCVFEDNGKAKLRHVVVHAIVEHEGKILLVKRADGMLEGGKWALPGGFMDINENAEQAALRELFEETGWEGEVVGLLCINTRPGRPHEDRQNVALDMMIRATKKTGEPDHETAQTEWIEIDSLPSSDSLAFDHGESIERYLSYRTKSFPIPVHRT